MSFNNPTASHSLGAVGIDLESLVAITKSRQRSAHLEQTISSVRQRNRRNTSQFQTFGEMFDGLVIVTVGLGLIGLVLSILSTIPIFTTSGYRENGL